MPLFTYKARDKKGKIIEETIQAASREDAASLLKADGLQVLTIKNLDSAVGFLFGGKVTIAEKANFCRFISTMLRAGLSLHEAAEIIKQESKSKKMQKILADIASQTRKGRSLSTILSSHKNVFDPVFLTMVKTGEESGTLDKSFDYLAKQLSASYELSQKITGSLMYPAVVITAMFGVGGLMFIFVLPRISDAFLKMNIPLPTMTKLILNFGQFVGNNVAFVLTTAFTLFLGAILAVFIPKPRKAILLLLSRFPAVQKVLNQMDVARFARTLSTLLRSSVPIIEALNVSAESLNQPRLYRQAKQFSVGISKGESLSEVLTKTKSAFPLIMIQTIKTGEKTGSLDEVLQELAEFYESEVEHYLKRLTSLLEPVLMLVIGIVVGAMVILIVAPIYSVIGNLQTSIQQ